MFHRPYLNSRKNSNINHGGSLLPLEGNIFRENYPILFFISNVNKAFPEVSTMKQFVFLFRDLLSDVYSATKGYAVGVLYIQVRLCVGASRSNNTQFQNFLFAYCLLRWSRSVIYIEWMQWIIIRKFLLTIFLAAFKQATSQRVC